MAHAGAHQLVGKGRAERRSDFGIHDRRAYGGAPVRLVLLHGFTQNRHCWAPFDRALSPIAELVALDAPGHGRSAGAPTDPAGAAAFVAAPGGRAIYLGYSMGGRLALQVALDHPDRVAGLVLVSASAGIADAAERAARKDADGRLAARIEQLTIGAFIDEWLAQPLFATLPRTRSHIAARRTNDPRGLAASLRGFGAGAQPPLWSRLGELAVPVLVVAGALDAKYTALGREMAAAIGRNARFTEIPHAGHTVHLEQPYATAREVNRWLAAFAAATAQR